MAVGGTTRYPTLDSIATLFRARINDTFNNTGGSGTGSGNSQGLIMSNANPDLLTFMNSALQETFSDLRNVGDPELILRNYLLLGIPPLAQADPTVQVAISFVGYFNGFTFDPTWLLPAETCKVIAMYERQTGTNGDFQWMRPAPFGLPGVMQGNLMGYWEWRQNQVWMPGCLLQTDLRMDLRVSLPEYLDPTSIDFATAYVPILDCRNAVVAKMLVLYAGRFAPDMYQFALSEEDRYMKKLTLEVVRQMQVNENERAPFGDEAVQDFAISWAWL